MTGFSERDAHPATPATIADLADGNLTVVGTSQEVAPGFQSPWYRNARAQLVYAARGVLSLTTRDGAWTVPPAMAIWVPPAILCSVSAPGTARTCTLYIDPTRVAALPDACRVIDVGSLLRAVILRLAALPPAEQATDRSQRLVSVLLDELGHLPPSPLHVPIPTDTRLVAVTDALRANPADQSTLARFARECDASERNLARLFLKDTGLSFGQWRTRLRLLAAIRRLGEGESVQSVAAELGYSSPSAFVAMFRRTLGMPPRQFMHAGDGGPESDEPGTVAHRRPERPASVVEGPTTADMPIVGTQSAQSGS